MFRKTLVLISIWTKSNATNKIFGDEFQFEMLVKNKLNDNYKKVCYASIDGLEHNKSNTAKYLKLSIILLEKLKKYIGDCDIPIFKAKSIAIPK